MTAGSRLEMRRQGERPCRGRAMGWLRRKPKIDEALLAALMDRVVVAAKIEVAQRFHENPAGFLEAYAIAVAFGDAGASYDLGDEAHLLAIIADGAALTLGPADQIRFVQQVTLTYRNSFMLAVMAICGGAFEQLMDDLVAAKASVASMFGDTRDGQQQRTVAVGVGRSARKFGVRVTELPPVAQPPKT